MLHLPQLNSINSIRKFNSIKETTHHNYQADKHPSEEKEKKMKSSRLPLRCAGFMVLAAVLCGCGPDKTVTVGPGEGSGVIKRDIDTARGNAAGVSDRIKTGEKDVYGG